MTAGAIAVAQALTSGLRTFKIFHDAGADIDSLVDDISEAKLVIVDVEKAINDRERCEPISLERTELMNRLII